ncbi:hypothetical protein D3C87_873190 [compost metagenome]|uniref:hypothetical protein n=1 Tax=Pedobacter ghigonis TaxID=2730403 RepID=UPI000FC09D96|nr:hypothetical protein [Pedobacter ghigonis]
MLKQVQHDGKKDSLRRNDGSQKGNKEGSSIPLSLTALVEESSFRLEPAGFSPVAEWRNLSRQI